MTAVITGLTWFRVRKGETHYTDITGLPMYRRGTSSGNEPVWCIRIRRKTTVLGWRLEVTESMSTSRCLEPFKGFVKLSFSLAITEMINPCCFSSNGATWQASDRVGLTCIRRRTGGKRPLKFQAYDSMRRLGTSTSEVQVASSFPKNFKSIWRLRR